MMVAGRMMRLSVTVLLAAMAVCAWAAVDIAAMRGIVTCPSREPDAGGVGACARY